MTNQLLAEAAAPPPRPQVPYGLHPLLDLQLMMNALADNQVLLAKEQLRQSRQSLFCYAVLAFAYLALLLAFAA